MILRGDALDLILASEDEYDLIVTDPPYAFSGSGEEHAISATVAVVLREAAKKLKRGRWMVVFSASSTRSVLYAIEAVRGVLDPVRIGTWCKPESRTKARTTGWAWASVSVVAFRKGKDNIQRPTDTLDHITAPVVKQGRRAELPYEVCHWAVSPFATLGGLMLDPFAGSGALLNAAEQCGMRTVGFERSPA